MSSTSVVLAERAAAARALGEVRRATRGSLPSASQYQTGMRWPHQSWREMHQSRMFSIQW